MSHDAGHPHRAVKATVGIRVKPHRNVSAQRVKFSESKMNMKIPLRHSAPGHVMAGRLSADAPCPEKTFLCAVATGRPEHLTWEKIFSTLQVLVLNVW